MNNLVVQAMEPFSVTGGAAPVFSPLIYSASAQFLRPADLARHMRVLAERGEAIMARLQAPEGLANAGELAEAVHSLGGSMGTFGFVRLAAAAARFEHVVEADPPELPGCADQLAEAISMSLTVLQEVAGTVAAAP